MVSSLFRRHRSVSPAVPPASCRAPALRNAKSARNGLPTLKQLKLLRLGHGHPCEAAYPDRACRAQRPALEPPRWSVVRGSGLQQDRGGDKRSASRPNSASYYATADDVKWDRATMLADAHVSGSREHEVAEAAELHASSPAGQAPNRPADIWLSRVLDGVAMVDVTRATIRYRRARPGEDGQRHRRRCGGGCRADQHRHARQAADRNAPPAAIVRRTPEATRRSGRPSP